MPNAVATMSLPCAVGELPAPVETTPGTYVVMTAQEESDRPWASPSRQVPIRPTVRTQRRRSTWASPWHDFPSISTALRARVGCASGRWTAKTLEIEAELRQELLSYARLEDNWDGDGAKAPSREAVNDALTFLEGRPDDIPPPYPEEGTDGDVGVYWDYLQTKVFAEVIFEGDGTFAYFAVRGVPGMVVEKYGNEGVNVVGPWPAELLRILRLRDST